MIKFDQPRKFKIWGKGREGWMGLIHNLRDESLLGINIVGGLCLMAIR